MDIQFLRNEISEKIEDKVGRPLLDLIEEYNYSVIIDKSKVLELLTCIYGFSEYIRKKPQTKHECIQMMVKTREKVEVLYKVFSSNSITKSALHQLP